MRKFGWRDAPDRADVHRHDAAGVRIKANVEFAGAALGRGAWRRVKILIPRNAGRRWIPATETCTATAAGARQQFDFHVDAFASRRVRDGHHCVLLGAVTQGTNIGDLGLLLADW